MQEKYRLYRHRLWSLRILNTLLITIQVIGMAVCSFWIIYNFLDFTFDGLQIAAGGQLFSIESNFMNELTLVISILLFFPKPQRWKDDKADLKLAVKYLKNQTVFGDNHNLAFKNADRCITEADKAYIKKKTGKKDEIEPHEKRMLMRKWLIIWGLAVICTLTIVLLWRFQWNVPQVLSVDILLGYGLIMFEAYYYQILLKKSNVNVMSKSHKDIIKNPPDKTASDEDKTEYQKLLFKAYKKIYHMKADRYSNYLQVLDISTAITNIIAVLITILDSNEMVNFQKLFALETRKTNVFVSLIFMSASVLLYVTSLVFESVCDTNIKEWNNIECLDYSEQNFLSLKESIGKIRGKCIFSRMALDVGRGIYDFNNDMLVTYYLKGDKAAFIPAEVMLTVRESFPGRVPRYKLTAAVVWLCGFCSLVWGKHDITWFFPVSVISLFIYIALVGVNALHLWGRKYNWILFEKERNAYSPGQDTLWDFMVYFTMLLLIICCICCFGSNLPVAARIAFIAAVAIFNIGGCIAAMKKIQTKGIRMNQEYNVFFILILGIAYCIMRYALMPESMTMSTILVNIFIIPFGIEAAVSHLLKMETVAGGVSLPVPACLGIFGINTATIYVLLNYDTNVPHSFLGVFFTWIYVACIISVAGTVFWKIKLLSETN